MGQGAALALEDAQVLSELLSGAEPVPRVWQRFEGRRRNRVERIQLQSWRFGRMAQWESAAARWLRNALVRLTPARVPERALERLLTEPL